MTLDKFDETCLTEKILIVGESTPNQLYGVLYYLTKFLSEISIRDEKNVFCFPRNALNFSHEANSESEDNWCTTNDNAC